MGRAGDALLRQPETAAVESPDMDGLAVGAWYGTRRRRYRRARTAGLGALGRDGGGLRRDREPVETARNQRRHRGWDPAHDDLGGFFARGAPTFRFPTFVF